MKQLVRHITEKIFMLAMGMLLLAPALLSASEAIVLKNGPIVEGNIISNTLKNLIIDVNGEQRTYAGNTIEAIHTNNNWKEKKYIYLKNGTVIEGYILGENKNNRLIRKNLDDTTSTPIPKETISFIARTKISELIDPPPLFGEGRNMFRNLIGFRLITSLALTPIATPDADPMAFYLKSIPIGLGIFYYDKYFEADLEFFPNVAGVYNNFSAIFTAVPFTMWRIGLGFSLGMINYEEGTHKAGPFLYPGSNFGRGKPNLGESAPPYLLESGIMSIYLGLTYRIPNLMRIGAGYPINMNSSVNLIDNTEKTWHYKSDDKQVFNFYAFAEFWVWQGLSLRLSYLTYGVKGTGYDDLPAPEIVAEKIDYQNHIISFSIGYAFQLGDVTKAKSPEQ